MKVKNNETVSAQVILQPVTGKAPDTTSEVTTQTLHRYIPSPAATTKAMEFFAELGFQVGFLVGIAFSITGPSHLFENVFGVELEWGEDFVLLCKSSDGVISPELSNVALPAELQVLIANVVFEPPSELM